jgi:hypothetical protein
MDSQKKLYKVVAVHKSRALEIGRWLWALQDARQRAYWRWISSPTRLSLCRLVLVANGLFTLPTTGFSRGDRQDWNIRHGERLMTEARVGA